MAGIVYRLENGVPVEGAFLRQFGSGSAVHRRFPGSGPRPVCSTSSSSRSVRYYDDKVGVDLKMVLARQRDGEGSKRGDHTGPSPTDRAKTRHQTPCPDRRAWRTDRRRADGRQHSRQVDGRRYARRRGLSPQRERSASSRTTCAWTRGTTTATPSRRSGDPQRRPRTSVVAANNRSSDATRASRDAGTLSAPTAGTTVSAACSSVTSGRPATTSRSFISPAASSPFSRPDDDDSQVRGGALSARRRGFHRIFYKRV